MERFEDLHIPSELLERFAVRGIPADQPEITNHLMACDLCGEAYEHELLFKEQIVEAAQRSAKSRPKQSRFAFAFAFARPVMVAAAALFFFMIVNTQVERKLEPAQVLEIAAVRGAETVQARSGVPLVLRLDTTGLELPSKVSVTLVNSTGNAVWTGAAQQADKMVEARTGQGLARGRYGGRIPAPAQPGESLREFQLIVQ